MTIRRTKVCAWTVTVSSALAITLSVACQSAQLHDPDNDEAQREKMARETAAKQITQAIDAGPPTVVDAAEVARLRASYVALPPTAAPVGSTFWGKICPDSYGPVLERDSGTSYCGKICGAYSPCDDDAGRDACCHTHACNRRLSSLVPGRTYYDGPPPSACSP